MKPTRTPDGRVLLEGRTLDAPAVDKLIRALAEIRSQLEPPVPTRWAPRQEIDTVFEPSLKVGTFDDEAVVLAIRHDGLGWCCFGFAPETAAALRDMLDRHIGGLPGRLGQAGPEGNAH